MSEDRFKEIFGRITADTPDAPAFYDLETHRATPLTPTRLKPWMAATGAAVLVLVVVGLFGLLGGGGPDLAAPDENTIDYVKLEYSATVNPVCEGGEIIDNGGFDEATIEIWGPNSDDLTLMVATFPDGTTERMITEGENLFNPDRAWGIDPSVFEEETGFRSVRCSNPPDWAIGPQGLLNPPYRPGFTPYSYLQLPPGYETWDEALDYDTTLSELNGNAVTIHSRTESLTPAGEYHVEFYVSLDEPDQLLGQFYKLNVPGQGSQTTEMTVVDLKRVPTDSVSFSTAGLFFIGKPGVEILEEGEIPADCPVTFPSRPFTPPDGYPATPSDPDSVWFGKDELWTALSPDGTYDPRKSVWWSVNFPGGSVEPEPELKVRYTLLNSPRSLTFETTAATNAHTDADGWFIIAGLDTRYAGCWEVTAIYKDASLSYVYYNPDGADPEPVVPDVIGMTVERAGNVLHDAGYEASFHDSAIPTYEVCAQEPGAGLEIDPGETIGMRTAPPDGCDELMSPTAPDSCDQAPDITDEPTVYFNCGDTADPDPTPVQRVFTKGLPIEAAVAEVFADMLQGPTLAEQEAGYSSFFSEGTAGALLSVTYREDTQGFVVDFTDAILVNNASTATGSTFFLADLLANAFQFEEVETVEFRVNGSCEAFWEFLQAGECNVLDRAGWEQMQSQWDNG